MKKLIHVTLIILLWSNTISLFANTNYQTYSSDSLVLKKNNSKKEVIAFSGRKVKIWKKNKQKIKGTFKNIENKSLILITKENKQVEIALESIRKIKLFNSEEKTTLATFFTTFGVIGIAGGIIILSIPTGGSAIGGSLAAGYSGAAGGFGILSLTVGKLLSAKKYNLNRNWSIRVN